MNIGVDIKYNGTTARVEFPCDYNLLYSALTELRMPDEDKPSTKLFIENVEMDELKGLRHQYIYPDQIQHLSQRLKSMTDAGTNKFLAVVKLENMSDIKDMINLTYNMHRYTLIQDMSSMENVGRVHTYTRDILISGEEANATDFEKIGKELMESGNGRVTKYGLVFANDDLEYNEVYDGKTLPEFDYWGCFATVEIEHNGIKSYVYLPEVPMAIDMAVSRVGARNECECRIRCTRTGAEGTEIKMSLDEILKSEGIKSLNKVVNEVDQLRGKYEVDKLAAIINYAEASDSERISKIISKLDHFMYIEDATSYEEIAEYFIDDNENTDYYVSTELRDYIRDEDFAKDMMDKQHGKFIDEGVVMIDPAYRPEPILDMLKEQDEEQGMTMGGM